MYCVADVEEQLSSSPLLDQAQNVYEGLRSQREPLPREAPRGAGNSQLVGGWREICSLYTHSLCCEKFWKKPKGLDQPVFSRLRS